MANLTNRMAFYDLRDWWLSNARVASILNSTGRTVFVPASQQPETGYPYARYNVERIVGMPDYWMHTEFVVVEVYAVDIEETTELLNVLASLTGRGSDSAMELQQWVAAQPLRPNDFQYHWLEFAGGGQILAPDEEGAAHGRTMNFAINYSPVEGFGIR